MIFALLSASHDSRQIDKERERARARKREREREKVSEWERESERERERKERHTQTRSEQALEDVMLLEIRRSHSTCSHIRACHDDEWILLGKRQQRPKPSVRDTMGVRTTAPLYY